MDANLLLWLVPVNIVVGACSGLIAGLFGLGGGVVIVPAVFLQLELIGFDSDLAFRVAVVTALAHMLPTSISSVRAHYSRGSLRPELAARLALGIFLGAAFGAWLGYKVEASWLMFSFALVLALLALNSFFDVKAVSVLPNSQLLSNGLAGVIGCLAVMLGIGGGSMVTPLLLLCSVPVLHAVGTASLAGLLVSLPGLGMALLQVDSVSLPLPLSYGYLNVPIIATLVPCGIVGAQLGAALAHRLPARALRQGFALFLLVVSGRMFVSALS